MGFKLKIVQKLISILVMDFISSSDKMSEKISPVMVYIGKSDSKIFFYL